MRRRASAETHGDRPSTHRGRVEARACAVTRARSRVDMVDARGETQSDVSGSVKGSNLGTTLQLQFLFYRYAQRSHRVGAVTVHDDVFTRERQRLHACFGAE